MNEQYAEFAFIFQNGALAVVALQNLWLNALPGSSGKGKLPALRPPALLRFFPFFLGNNPRITPGVQGEYFNTLVAVTG